MENQESVMEKPWKIHEKSLCKVCGNPGTKSSDSFQELKTRRKPCFNLLSVRL